MAAYARLDHYVWARGDTYRIRVNRTVRDALKGVDYVRIRKNEDYIVIEPANGTDHEIRLHLVRERSNCYMTVNALVSMGFLPAHWFGTGERFKVKKSKVGAIYICRKEVVVQDDDE